MAFWIFMLIMNLMIPVTMIGFGYLFLKHPPRHAAQPHTPLPSAGFRSYTRCQGKSVCPNHHRYSSLPAPRGTEGSKKKKSIQDDCGYCRDFSSSGYTGILADSQTHTLSDPYLIPPIFPSHFFENHSIIHIIP